MATGAVSRLMIRLCPCLLALCSTAADPAVAQPATQRTTARVRPPEFDAEDTQDIFFLDAFAEGLQGARPLAWSVNVPGGPDGLGHPPRTEPRAKAPGDEAGRQWSKLISREVLEDEVKLSAQRLRQVVTVPARFAGGDYRDASREFSWLGVLFAVIADDDQQVRWQGDAPAASVRFARAGGALRRGDAATFRAAQSTLDDLQDLIRGNPLAAQEDARIGTWSDIADRSLLMQRLESNFAERISPAVASESTARAQTESLVHAAQVIKLISGLLTQSDMDDADDQQYVDSCRQMLKGAAALEEAVQSGQFQTARSAAGDIYKACSNCHGTFRD